MTSETQTASTGFPLVIPTNTQAVTARLVLRNDLGQVVQQWLIRQNKCTLGSSSSCALRCEIPGIAPYHALIVVGARQIFVRALAPKLTRDGKQVNELLLTEENSHFEIGGNRFELSRGASSKEKTSAFAGQPENQRLKFTLARPLALNDRKQIEPESGTQTKSLGEKVLHDENWVARLVQAAIEPLECQLQNVIEPLAELQIEARKQRRLRRQLQEDRQRQEESRHAKISDPNFNADIQYAASPDTPKLADHFEELAARQSAAMDVISERICDVTQQLSAIERLVQQERETDEAAEAMEGRVAQNAAIEQLQSGMVSVSSALQELENRHQTFRREDQAWQAEMHTQLASLRTAIDTVAARVEEEQLSHTASQTSEYEWKNTIQEQLASLRESIQRVGEQTTELQATGLRNLDSDTDNAWKRDIQAQFTSIRQALDTVTEQTQRLSETPRSDLPNIAHQVDANPPLTAGLEPIVQPANQQTSGDDSIDSAASNAEVSSAEPYTAQVLADQASYESTLMQSFDFVTSDIVVAQPLNPCIVENTAFDFISNFETEPLVDLSEKNNGDFAEPQENPVDPSAEPFLPSTESISTPSTKTDSFPLSPFASEENSPSELPQSESAEVLSDEISLPMPLLQDADTNVPAPNAFESGSLTLHEPHHAALDDHSTPSINDAVEANSVDALADFDPTDVPDLLHEFNSEGNDLNSRSESTSAAESSLSDETQTNTNSIRSDLPTSAEDHEVFYQADALLNNAFSSDEAFMDDLHISESADTDFDLEDTAYGAETVPDASFDVTTDGYQAAIEDSETDDSGTETSESASQIDDFDLSLENSPLEELQNALPSWWTEEEVSEASREPTSFAPEPTNETLQPFGFAYSDSEPSVDSSFEEITPSVTADDSPVQMYESSTDETRAAAATGPDSEPEFYGLVDEIEPELPSHVGVQSDSFRSEPLGSNETLGQHDSNRFEDQPAGLTGNPNDPEQLGVPEDDQSPLVEPSSAEASATGIEENNVEDESVEDYMRKLLARMRGVPEEQVDLTAGAKPTVPSSSKPTEPIANLPRSDTNPKLSAVPGSEVTTEVQSGDETQPFDPDDYLPRGVAPERMKNLAAMRELANSSARTAIHKSTRKRHLSSILLKIGIAGVGLIVGGALIAINGLQVNIGLIATVAAFLVAAIWGFDAVTSLKPLLQSGLVLTPSPAVLNDDDSAEEN